MQTESPSPNAHVIVPLNTISHVSKIRDFTVCSELCKLLASPFGSGLKSPTAYQAFTFLDPALLLTSYLVSQPLFPHSSHISPFSISTCATLFSSGSSQIVFLCEEHFSFPLVPTWLTLTDLPCIRVNISFSARLYLSPM